MNLASDDARPFRAVRFHRLLPGVLMALAACKGASQDAATPTPEPPKSATISNEFTAAADVIAIAPATRRITLRREDGDQFEVTADASVRNFDQIKVGDALRVRYQEELSVRICGPDEPMGTAQGGVVAARAKPGEKPGGGVGAGISLRVRIESIDREREIVTFSLSSGELIARKLQTAKGRDFVRGLKTGDVVQLDITSVLALAIESR